MLHKFFTGPAGTVTKTFTCPEQYLLVSGQQTSAKGFTANTGTAVPPHVFGSFGTHANEPIESWIVRRPSSLSLSLSCVVICGQLLWAHYSSQRLHILHTHAPMSHLKAYQVSCCCHHYSEIGSHIYVFLRTFLLDTQLMIQISYLAGLCTFLSSLCLLRMKLI